MPSLEDEVGYDIVKELKVWAVRNDESVYSFEAFARALDTFGAVKLDVGTAKLLKSGSDYEDSSYRVFQVGENGKIFKIDGSSDSWGGSEWDAEPYEVRAQPVNEVQYFRV